MEGIGPLQEAVAEAAADRARVDQVAQGLQEQVAKLEQQLAGLATVQSRLSAQQVIPWQLTLPWWAWVPWLGGSWAPCCI